MTCSRWTFRRVWKLGGTWSFCVGLCTFKIETHAGLRLGLPENLRMQGAQCSSTPAQPRHFSQARTLPSTAAQAFVSKPPKRDAHGPIGTAVPSTHGCARSVWDGGRRCRFRPPLRSGSGCVPCVMPALIRPCQSVRRGLPSEKPVQRRSRSWQIVGTRFAFCVRTTWLGTSTELARPRGQSRCGACSTRCSARSRRRRHPR